jgi:protoheme IX farnesyltransferase
MTIRTQALPLVPTASWRSYLKLCKIKVVSLVVFTALVSMVLASPPGSLPWATVLAATIGIALAGASAAAFNHIADREIDTVMGRTQNRPLPTGNITRSSATLFATMLGTVALLILWTLVNPLTAVLTLLTLIGYAVIYTRYLKWIGPQNIVLGGASGAAPAMLGWCAITGTIGWEALALFLIIFVWTPPHFWALAIARREEYAKAGVPMMPVIHGVAYTKRSIFAYAMVLIPVSYLPVTVGLSGPFYLIGATILGGIFAVRAYHLMYVDSDRLAMRLFGFSITYLTVLFALLLVDHYLPVSGWSSW